MPIVLYIEPIVNYLLHTKFVVILIVLLLIDVHLFGYFVVVALM
jgi:hypothetical protein